MQALALIDYDDILAPADVYSLVALISALHQAFFQCSKVTMTLLQQFNNLLVFFFPGICRAGVPRQCWRREENSIRRTILGNIYQVRLLNILCILVYVIFFYRHSPRDIVSNKINCPNCGAMINDW